MSEKNSGRAAYGRDRPASSQAIREGRRVEPWTPPEDAVLHRLYPIGGWRLVHDELPHRSEMGIRARARRLGIDVLRPESPAPGEPKRRAKPERWTPEQIATLRRMSGTHTTMQIAAALGKTRRQVDKKRRRFDLMFHGSRVQQKEHIRKVRNWWPTPKADRIAPPEPRFPSVWHYAQGASA